MRNVYCPYCGRQAEYVDSKVIYGRSYGMAYLCRKCGRSPRHRRAVRQVGGCELEKMEKGRTRRI